MIPSIIVQQLEANAVVFETHLRNWEECDATWQPSPGKWSLLEIVNHLADEEAEDFRTRLRLALESPGEAWLAIDPEGWVAQRQYAQRIFGESIDRFLSARRESVRWLQSLSSVDWNATHVHPKIGPFTAQQVLEAWLAHDFLHLRQIARLRVELVQSQVSELAFRYAGG